MYRGTPSPIFDVPEFPALRRVKPLPKRRRTSSGTGPESAFPLAPTSASVQATQSAIALLQQDAAAAFLQQQHQSLDALVSNGTAEELLVHADSARMALQNYYMPILGGVQSFLAGTVTHGNTEGGNSNTTAATAAAAALAAVANAGRNGQLPLPLNDMDSIEFGVHFAAAAAAAAAAGVAMGGLGGLGMGLTGMNMTMGTGMVAGAGGGHGGSTGSSHGRDDEDEDGRGDGDYADHFRQPGNTKKRKVPANASGSPRGGDRPGSPSSPYMEDEGTEGALGGGAGFGAPSEELLRDRDRDRGRDRDRDRDRGYESTPPPIYPPPPFPGQLSLLVRKRGKLTAVTLAGLQHKEMLKTRKRQLAAVMGALSHGDTLALDQALSASYPLVGGSDSSGSHGSVVGGRGASGESPPIRKSKRRTVRLARAMKVIMDMPERRNRHPDAVPFPTSVFDFVCPSGTADRLIATKEEVAMLRKRFEVELERQAAKAAKMAVASANGGKGFGKGGRGKRERQERDRERVERAQHRAKAITGTTGPVGGDQSPESVDSGIGGAGLGGANALGGAGGKAKNGKKKKRSALANASNPHHLRNYVPSRLPHTGPGEGGAAAHGSGGTGANANGNTIWPLPLRFLSSEIPPRRRSRAKNSTPPTSVPLIQLTHPAEEWICAFCEYDLFYGEDAGYRRAVRNRKKILKRRRRARERAAAAAAGGAGAGMSAVKGPPPPPPPSEEYDAYEDSVVGVDEFGSAPGHGGGRWKGAPDKEEAAAFG